MRVTTMIKMRLIHGEFCATNCVNETLYQLNVCLPSAFLCDSRRDKLRTMYNSLKRKGIDERNSDTRELTIWQECCDDYNDSSWEPNSIEFPELHSKLSVSVSLSLQYTAKEMLPEMAMKVIKGSFRRR